MLEKIKSLFARKKKEPNKTVVDTYFEKKPEERSKFNCWSDINQYITKNVAKDCQLRLYEVHKQFINSIMESTLKKDIVNGRKENYAMDNLEKTLSIAGIAMDNQPSPKAAYQNNYNIINPQIFNFYIDQGFIGWNTCALMSQHWAISKACLRPAKDAVRKGYDIKIKNEKDLDPETKNNILADLREKDTEFKINYNLINFVQFGRIFGIRLAIFLVESDDPDFYYKPFNIDGVKPGSYKGICQVDPYWCAPQLDADAAGNPLSIGFYEPTWWFVSGDAPTPAHSIRGKMIHKSHIIKFVTIEVADFLKPAYIYGGIPIPQLVYQRAYQAEMTANDASRLIKTKRLNVLKTDTNKIAAEPQEFQQRMSAYVSIQDSFGVFAIDKEDEAIEQLITPLDGVEENCLLQWQLFAASAEMIVTKVLESSPKGWGSEDSYEESSYAESLETVQNEYLKPFLERHHLLLITSEIEPKYGVKIKSEVNFKPLDAMTEKELADLNKQKADTDATLSQIGAIDGQDARNRLINDAESGYTMLDPEAPEQEEPDDFSTEGANNDDKKTDGKGK